MSDDRCTPFSFDDLSVQMAAAQRRATEEVADQYRRDGNPSMARLADMKAAGLFDGAAFPSPPAAAARIVDPERGTGDR